MVQRGVSEMGTKAWAGEGDVECGRIHNMYTYIYTYTHIYTSLSRTKNVYTSFEGSLNPKP